MSHSRQATSHTPTPSSQVSTISHINNSSAFRLSGTLILRAENDSSASTDESASRRIRWSEDVVDNEGMGKKSSKVCCIYHKARPVGESSSESDDSDSSSSESDSDTEPGNTNVRRPCHNGHRDESNRPPRPPAERGRTSYSKNQNRKHQRRRPSPNAYEKMPKYSKES